MIGDCIQASKATISISSEALSAVLSAENTQQPSYGMAASNEAFYMRY
jgi:hypothetical protein